MELKSCENIREDSLDWEDNESYRLSAGVSVCGSGMEAGSPTKKMNECLPVLVFILEGHLFRSF
jgi:hypothetical protein